MRDDVAEARQAWLGWQRGPNPKSLVFADQTWTSTNMAPRYGRGPRGPAGRRRRTTLQGLLANHGHWKTTTFVAALRHDRITAHRPPPTAGPTAKTGALQTPNRGVRASFAGPMAPRRVRAQRSYHRALERHLAAAGIGAVKINPLQVRRFAEAVGTRAKTDAVDARLIAAMAAQLDLPTNGPAP